DDSTDETTARARARVRRWRRKGVRVELVRREERSGYKAGALQHGLESADGEFLLILDADFVPSPDLLHRLLPPFRDREVGMVQARWDHLNEGESWLTRTQALLLDGHFFLEQGGRYAADRFFNFNGTAGIWRRSCLEEAGGWEADTLTEDLDLSYRAQMAGWRFVFLDDVGVPAEIPSRAGALEVQQRRWAQGGIQTARKLLPRLLRSARPWPVKLEAVVHLCGHLAHPLTLALGLLLLPSALARRALGMEELLGLDLLVFAAATVPFLLFYGAAGRRRRRPWPRLLPDVVRTMALGVGLTAPVSRAVLRGLRSTGDGFVRTPKRGGSPRSAYGGKSPAGDTALKLTLAGVMAVYAVGAAATGFYASLPFIALFGGGWLALGLAGLRDGSPAPVLPAPGEGLPGQEKKGGHPEDDPEPEGLGPAPGLPEPVQAPVAEECEAA
ncbi:MAG TPA: glycosyltransferase, partial [Longimicrobiales bacterium]|nr:glycosyltransferase [Longimicrobiales bacterium]